MQLTLTCVVTWVVSLVFLVIAIIKVFPTSGVHITQNPYSKNVLLWPVKLDGHWPVRMDFDFVIKSDIVNYARSLTGPHAVIDCGAHIGDGAVPIAAALADAGRGGTTPVRHFGLNQKLNHSCKPYTIWFKPNRETIFVV